LLYRERQGQEAATCDAVLTQVETDDRIEVFLGFFA
jgi:hypothetical protein